MRIHILKATAIVVITAGILVLLGWQADILVLKQILPVMVAMNPITAVLFLCLGAAFLLLLQKPQHNYQRIIANALSIVVMLIAVAKIAAVLHYVDTSVDNLLYAEKIKTTLYNGSPNAMAPQTAVALLLSGLSLFLLGTGRIKASQWMALPVAGLGLLSVIGYSYHISSFYHVTSFIPMSFHAGICLLLFSTALLFVESKQGFVAEITHLNAGGKAARILLPAAVFVPFILGYLILNGVLRERFSVVAWVSLFVTAVIIIFGFLVWVAAYIINKFETQRLHEKQVADEQLKQSAEYILDLYNNAPCGYHTFNSEGYFVDINTTELNWLGYTREEMIGKLKFTDILTEESKTRFHAALPAYMETGVIQDFFLDLTRKNGTVFTILLSAFAIKDAEGNVLQSRATILDYTERKKQDDKIRQFNRELEKQVHEQTKQIISKEQQYRFLLENMREGAQLIDFSWRYLFVNKSFLDQSRRAHIDEFVGRKMTDKFPDIESSAMFAALQRCMHNRVAEQIEDQYKFPDGSKGWFQLSIEPVPEGLFILSKDITEQKKAEAEIRQSQERYQTLMNSVEGIVWEADANTLVFSFVSQQAERLLGYPVERWINDPNFWADHIHEDDRTWAVNYCAKNTSEGKSHQFEYRMMAADGRMLWLRDIVAVEMEDNKPVRLSGIMVDITETKKMEEELSKKMIAQQKLITETTILAQEKERNELGLELHDNINQLLSVVKLYLGMAKAEELVSKDIIDKSYEHLDEAMNEIRKLSHSLVAPSLGHDGLKEALEDLVESVQHLNPISIALYVNDDYNVLPVDKNKELMIYRIVQEQLTNIIKYADASEASIHLKQQGNSLYLLINDNGVGFDIDQPGKGIGLKNINSRVNFYSGKMNLTSAQGEGCKLEVYIPN